MSNPELSIVIPVFNEEGNLFRLAERLIETISSTVTSYEIIFVDDASTDGSLKKIKEIKHRYTGIRYLSFSRNFGHQAALTAGLSRARGRAVVTMDADLQDPPELISSMVKLWAFGNGAKVVNAVPVRKKEVSFLKKSTASIFYRFLERSSGVPPPHPGDFRLMDNEVIQLLNRMPEHHRFLRGLVSWVGFKQEKVIFERPGRFEGTTKYSFSKMIKLAIDGITSFSNLPLRLASYFGFGCAMVSLIYALRVIILKISRGTPVRGWTSIIVAVLFLGGIQLLTIGIIGEYLGRIAEEVKNRPRFIVSEED